MKLLFKLALCLSVLPFVSYAAYDDATLQATDTELSIAGVTVTLEAPGALIESIQVNGSTMTLIMPGQSYLKIKSTDRRNLTATNYAPVKLTSTCSASESIHYFESPSEAPAITFTATVETSTCTTGGTSGGGGSPGGSGGGGGSGSVVSSRAQKVYPDGTKVYLDEPGAAAKIAELDAKFASKPQAAAVAAAVTTVASPKAAVAIAGTVDRLLTKGMTNPGVRTLQRILNSDPDTQVSASGIGSPGNESDFFGAGTLKAVQRFQVKHGLANPGDEGYGIVGPKTRAKLNGMTSSNSAAPAAVTAVTSMPASDAITRSLAKGSNHAEVKVLQRILNSDPETRIAASGAGSPGAETTLFGPATQKALQRFQEKHGIAGPGEAGYGTVGPKTRAKLNSMLGSVEKQIDDAMKQIQILQEQLKNSQ